MMGACKTCEFWIVTDNSGWGHCVLATTKDGGRPIAIGSLAYSVADDDQIGGILKTHAEFGCTRYQESCEKTRQLQERLAALQ